MFSEWRKRSTIFVELIEYGTGSIVNIASYELARAAFKAGVRAGIKQEQARRKK